MTVGSAGWVGRVLAGGRYQVTGHLGEGGMAFVYRARDTSLQREVVIKVPRPAMLEDPEFAGRFSREVRSLAALAHPHIVKVLDAGEDNHVPFLVLEYLPGGSLRQRLDRPARPVPELLGWLPAVADALDTIHRQHCLHRDVKPDNILFDAHSHPYLSDLGIIKVLEAGSSREQQTVLTRTGMVLGTPQYMAPELILGEACDGRADQYSLAVTIYEVVSGRVPFEGATPAAIVLGQTTRPPRPLSEVRPGVPRALSEAVQRALARDPRKRFPTCGALARAVLAALQVPETGPQGPPPRSSRARPASPSAETGRNVPAERTQPVAVAALPQGQEEARAPTPWTGLGIGCLAAGGLALVLLVATLTGVSLLGRQLLFRSPPSPNTAGPVVAVPQVNLGPANSSSSSSWNGASSQVFHSSSTWSSSEVLIDLGNGLQMEFVGVPHGTFLMGSSADEEGRSDDEGPQHEVEITQDFYLGKYPVTQEQYERITGKNPSWFSAGGRDADKVAGLDTRRFPVENVSWGEAADFCKRLTEKHGGGVKKFRLPTEAEWEYACRAGTRTRYYFGNDDGDLKEYAWYMENSGGRTHQVGTRKPNACGLMDMHGNVLEWCRDYWDEPYPPGKATDPQGPVQGSHHVLRGGSWASRPKSCRSACRGWRFPVACDNETGFRVVLTLN